MILTCPECSVSYKTSDDAIGANGRTVKCAQCEAVWFAPASDLSQSTPDALQLKDIQSDEKQDLDVTAKTEALAPPIASGSSRQSTHKSADAIIRDKADAAKRRSRLRVIWLIWFVPLFFLTALFFILFFGRDTIAGRFPAAVPFYNAVGVDVSESGLRIIKPEVSASIINGEPTFIINGEIKNLSNESKKLPMLELAFHNPDGDEVANWRVELNSSTIAGNEKIAFVSEYPNPPPDSVSLRYKLAE